MKHYSTEEQIREVVDGFEQCTTPKEQFTHREHLTVATWYLCHSNPAESLNQMRDGLLRFLDHHGVGRVKYKEQLTVSWMALVQSSVQQMDAQLSIVERTNRVLDELGNSRLVAAAKIHESLHLDSALPKSCAMGRSSVDGADSNTKSA